MTWKRLNHVNVVPFIGVTFAPLQIVSEWMSGGDLTAHIKSNPQTNRISLVSPPLTPSRNAALAFQQLVDVAEGVNYLHKCDVVHGDLKGVSSNTYQTLVPFLLPNPGIAYQTRVAKHHAGRRRTRAYNRFRSRSGSRRRRGNRRNGRRHRAVDCAGNPAGARGTEQTRRCFLFRDGHGRGGFGMIRP